MTDGRGGRKKERKGEEFHLRLSHSRFLGSLNRPRERVSRWSGTRWNEWAKSRDDPLPDRGVATSGRRAKPASAANK